MPKDAYEDQLTHKTSKSLKSAWYSCLWINFY